METSFYRLWVELVPSMRRWEWWLQCSWIGPGKGRWLRKAEDQLRVLAARKGATLIGDPIAYTKDRNGRVVVAAEAIAVAPHDPAAPVDHAPAGGEG